MAEEAVSFKPTGQLISSYTRPSPLAACKGKGKGVERMQNLDPGSVDTIEFEVYHVRSFSLSIIIHAHHSTRQRGIHLVSGNTTDECNYLFCYILKQDHILMRRMMIGSSSYCK